MLANLLLLGYIADIPYPQDGIQATSAIRAFELENSLAPAHIVSQPVRGYRPDTDA